MGYTTIITEGGLLPADVLDVIASEDAPGQRAEDFGLERGRNLKDRIAAAWQAARGQWVLFQSYADDLRAGDAGTSVTRQRWVLPLLDVLGYQVTFNPSAHSVEGRSFAISHRADVQDDAPPVHVEGFRTSLDARPPSGRPRVSPHALMQEFLNGSEHVWGVVTNGERLRVLRDSSRLTRPAFVEFDLRAMFEGEVFSEFALLYRVLHRSRLPATSADAAGCWLETYHQQAIESGGRVREKLRAGVEQALKVLGNGLLAHPANAALREKVRAGRLTPLALYRQLLKLVYRLLFLMVTEERNLIAAQADEDDALSSLAMRASGDQRLAMYHAHYSVARLRRLSEQPGAGRGPFDDLWLGLQTTFRVLEGSDEQGPRGLGLAALDGDLFGPLALADVAGSLVRNAALLDAVRALSLYHEQEARVLRRVNYGALDVEELGSVYESLLDYRPVISADATQFDLVSGTERKTTGSYYTRPELVQELVKSALVPVIEERLRACAADAQARERALLAISVCDPACGSGHFLLAAARRLGRELARVRSGEEQPTPAQFRRAVRDVIQQCVYGVDLNPLAVDLCKLALWIEGHNAGMPLNFLDHHIKQGNSLIGATRALVAAGVPDDAYKPLTGDDKKLAGAIKKRNRQERERYQMGFHQPTLFDAPTHGDGARLAQAFRQLDAMDSTSVAEVQAKAARYQALHAQAEDVLTHFNLWTAAFFLPLTPAYAPLVPTTATLAEHERAARAVRADVLGAANGQAAEVSFFHWELEFPQVFARGGFDVVLGNPPWEMLQLDPQEFFAGTAPDIAKAANMAARNKLIAKLQDDNPQLYAQYKMAEFTTEAQQKFVHESNHYPLTSFGRINLMALFAELSRGIIGKSGRAGLIVPTGIATDSFNQYFFADLVNTKQLVSLYDFENREGIFPGVHRSYKFCMLVMGETKQPTRFAFFASNIKHLQDAQRVFTLSTEEIALLSPNTRTCPVFRTQKDAELTKKIYRKVPILIDEEKKWNPWSVSFMLMFMMNTDSYRFHTAPSTDRLPLYEAKLLHQFTHRWATYDGDDARTMHADELCDPALRITPRYWVAAQDVETRLAERDWRRGWLLGFRDITNATNERTAIFSVLPRVAVGHKAPLVFIDSERVALALCFLSSVNSLVFDFIARQKVGGTSFAFFIFKQLPVLPPERFSAADIAYIVPRVLELVFTAWDISAFAQDVWAEASDDLRATIAQRNAACNADAPPEPCSAHSNVPLPPFRWNDERRAHTRAELDARIAHLYGLTRDELRYILDPADVYGPDFPGETFRVLKEKEIKQHGDYRTRRLVLAAWDAGGY